MQKSNSTAIIGVILFGVVAVGLTLYALTSGNSKAPAPSGDGGSPTQTAAAAPQTYYVASRQILPRTRITRDMLLERQSDGQPIPENAIKDPFEVIGKMANSIIEPGQIMTGNLTVQPVTRVIAANIPVPPGLRAVAVWVNPQETAAGLVDVGDRVDVITTNKLTGSTATSDNVEFISGRTIAQDLQVLAVDRSLQATATGTADPAKPQSSVQPADTSEANRTRVILAATPAQAQRITAANEAGTINLIIRNPGDSLVAPTGEALEYPVRLVASRPGSNEAAPPPAPRESAPPSIPAPSMPAMPAPQAPQTPPALPVLGPGQQPASSPFHEVTVIRGTEKSQVTVPK